MSQEGQKCLKNSLLDATGGFKTGLIIKIMKNDLGREKSMVQCKRFKLKHTVSEYNMNKWIEENIPYKGLNNVKITHQESTDYGECFSIFTIWYQI